MERRLAAIQATDVVGYARLIRADEEATLAALKGLRADLIDPTLAEHSGRIGKLMGDGMLAEVVSVVDPVRAAVETQRAVAERNADFPEGKRIEFRVGIHLGDVVIDGDDIQGDGVNVAARLEAWSRSCLRANSNRVTGGLGVRPSRAPGRKTGYEQKARDLGGL